MAEDRKLMAEAENFLAILCWRDEIAAIVAEQVTPDMMPTKDGRDMATKAIKYLHDQGQTPKIHIRDLFAEELMDPRRSQESRDFYRAMIDQGEALARDIQPDYMLERLNDFVTYARMTQANEAVGDALNVGDLDKARGHFWAGVNAGPRQTLLDDPWAELLPPPKSLELGLLPKVLRRFAGERAMATGADPAGFALTSISAAGVAIGGTNLLQIQTGFLVYPRFWSLILGPSGILKTPIMNATWNPLSLLQRATYARTQAKKDEWEKGGKEGPEPHFAQFVTNNATPEAIREILRHQDRGLGVRQNEWTAFIGQMEKYDAGKAALANRAFYLEGYDGGYYQVDRVGAGYIPLDNFLLTVCGGLQPNKIRDLGNLTDDGLLQRSALAILHKQRDGGIDSGSREMDDYAALIEMLAARPGNQTARLSLGAQRVYERVKKQREEWCELPNYGEAFQTHVGKFEGMWGSLALIFAHIIQMTERQGPLVEIDEDVAQAAEALVFGYLLDNLLIFYKWMGSGGNAEQNQKIASYLLSNQRHRLLPSDLTRDAVVRGSLGEIRKVVGPLVSMGWLEPEGNPDYARAWIVNQQIYRQFADRALQIRAARELIARRFTTRRGGGIREGDGVVEKSNEPSQSVNIGDHGLIGGVTSSPEPQSVNIGDHGLIGGVTSSPETPSGNIGDHGLLEGGIHISGPASPYSSPTITEKTTSQNISNGHQQAVNTYISESTDQPLPEKQGEAPAFPENLDTGEVLPLAGGLRARFGGTALTPEEEEARREVWRQRLAARKR